MALIRGFRGLCPCPVCLIPKKEQRNISEKYQLRTAANMRMFIEQAENSQTEAEKEGILKAQGIRAVPVGCIIKNFIYFCIKVDA